VLVYHAIAFWIPSVGGLLGYRRLRRHLPTDIALAPGPERHIAPPVTRTAATLPRPPLPAQGEPMQKPPVPHPQASPLTHRPAGMSSRSKLPRTALRRRDLEAHAVAWLRSLRGNDPVRSSSAERERAS
jgi:hypothetical protein